MKKKNIIILILIVLFFIFIIISFLINIKSGIEIGNNFIEYSLEMLKILPFTFILIGLFEVWVKRETIEKHLGDRAGFMSYVWAVLLGGTIVGPMIVALPIAYSLYNKGAKLSFIFTYVSAAAVCRIPMTIFEASYLGVKFTIIRYVVTIPLIVLTSIIFGKYLEKKNFKIKSGN